MQGGFAFGATTTGGASMFANVKPPAGKYSKSISSVVFVVNHVTIVGNGHMGSSRNLE